MDELETYCMRLLMAIKNGLSLFLADSKNDRVKTVNQAVDGLEAIIEFEGKEYRLRISPL